MTATPPRTALRRRLRLLEIGLVLPAIVTGILAIGYSRAVSARQEAVEAAGRQLARRAAERALVVATVLGDSAARLILGHLDRRSPGAALESIRRVTDSLRTCRCGPVKEGAFAFVWTTRADSLVTSAPPPSGYRPLGRLAPLLAMRPTNLGEILAIGDTGEDGPWLIHYTRVVVGRDTAIVGFDISMDSWWTGTFLPAIVATRRESFSMLPNPDTAFSAFLTAGDRVLGRDGADRAGPTAVVPPFAGTGFGLGVTLNPAILPVVLAAATPIGVPVAVGALIASFGASILALILLRQVRRTIAQREAFVASISHELRTPLTEVLLNAENLALERHGNERKDRAARAIIRETRRIIGLVENALTMAGAGRTGTRPRPPMTALGPPVREAIEGLAQAALDRKSRIEVTIEEDARAAVDPIAVDRIVTNLVGNALRYGPDGQTVRVTVGADRAGATITVEDQGPGVPERERARIWDPFERGAAADRSRSTGVGLGLAIVKQLVESVGGSVGIDDGTTGGARFMVTIPGAPERAGAAPDRQAAD